MILVSTDASLAELLASATLIAQTWPQAGDDVLLLIHILKVSLPSLAEALSTGLVVLVASSPRSSELTLIGGDAALRGLAQTKGGDLVSDPKRRTSEIVRIEIVDVVAEGRRALKVA